MSGVSGEPGAAGLSRAASLRLARFNRSGMRTSLMSVPGSFGARSVRLEPVGEVMGCVVQQLNSALAPTASITGPGLFGAFGSYIDQVRHGYQLAISRMVAEARALGAHGVIGVTITSTQLDPLTRELVALGSSVTTEHEAVPPEPFCTDLAGHDVAKLVRGGWMPVRLCVGVGGNFTFYDYRTQLQTSFTAGNTEVTNYTQLLNSTRGEARQQLRTQVAAAHADGAIVSDMQLATWPLGSVGLAATSVIRATAISRFRDETAATSTATSKAPTIAIMPLRGGRTP